MSGCWPGIVSLEASVSALKKASEIGGTARRQKRVHCFVVGKVYIGRDMIPHAMQAFLDSTAEYETWEA